MLTTDAKKILLVSSVFPPADAPEADYAFHLKKNLELAGHSVAILTSINSEVRDVSVSATIRGWGFGNLIPILRQIASHKTDVIAFFYIDFLYGDGIAFSCLPLLARILFRKRQIVTILSINRGVISPRQGSPLLFLWRFFTRFSRGWLDFSFGSLLTASHSTVVFTRRNLPSGARSTVILNPPPPLIERTHLDTGERSRFRNQLGAGASDHVLLFFGYLYPGKGIEELITATSLLIQKGISVKAWILGGEKIVHPYPGHLTYVRDLKGLAKQKGISANVRWLGGYPTGSRTASSLIQSADIGVLPFTSGVALNNSSISTLLNHSLPIVTTHAPGTDAEFVHEKNVLLCPPRDPDALAAAIERLVGDPKLARQLGDEGARFSTGCFSWNRCVERYESAFRLTESSQNGRLHLTFPAPSST